jgi:hypothetical protein
MTISDSLPIQFWDINDETHNEKVICGLAKQECYCQPIQCDDEINIQIQNTNPIALQIVDTNDNQLQIIDMTESSTGVFDTDFVMSDIGSPGICDETVQFKIVSHFQNGDFLASTFLPWTNSTDTNLGSVGANGFSVVANAAKVLIGGASNSKVLRQSVNFPPNTYTFRIDFTIVSSSASNVYFVLYNSTNSHTCWVFNSAVSPGEDPAFTSPNSYASGTYSVSVTITTTRTYQYIGLKLGGGGVGTDQISIDRIIITPDPITILAQSDCIDVRTDQSCTQLIEYTNSSDFDGLVYGTTSPDPTFYLRVPAQFYQEKNPQEQEDLELSNGQIVTIRQSIQEKRLLETGFMPGYMHRKLQKVLMHETITIDSDQWKRRDAYEDSPVKKYNLKRASVWLTKYDSVEKNTI